MKKLQFLSLAMAGLALVSCSDKDDSAAVPEATAGGYMSIALNMPTVSGNITRAANDNFNHGAAWEYGVHDAYLLLFGGSSEKTATVQGIYDISAAVYNTDNQTGNVTTRSEYVTKVNSVTNNMYAYVLLNYGAGDSPIATFSAGDLRLNGTSLMGKTIGDIQEIQNMSAYSFKTGYIPMANTPIASVAGGTTDPSSSEYTTLTKVDASQIKQSEDEAKAASAADIYVERAAVKVSLSDNTKNVMTLVETTSENQPIYGQVVGYILDNTNNAYTPARETASFSDWAGLKNVDQYRFVGSAKIDEAGYRSYWAKDNNYDTYKASDFYRYGFTTFNSNGTKAKYCPENTFDVDNQVWKQTTRAVLKVAIGTEKNADGSVKAVPFWIINPTVKDEKATIYTEATLTAKAQEVAFNAIKSSVASGSATDVTIAGIKASTGKVTPTATFGGTLNTGVDATAAKNEMNDALKDAFANLTYFVDGTCYYQVRIKHFGDDLTPWNNGETPAPSATEAYPGSSAEKYLGRYSVLRNNWYEIDVTGIARIGYSTVPSILPSGETITTPTNPKGTLDPNDPNNPSYPGQSSTDPYDPTVNPTDPYLPNPTYPVVTEDTPGVDPGFDPSGVDPREPNNPGNTPDDDIEADNYIKASINILSWAVRSQNVILK